MSADSGGLDVLINHADIAGGFRAPAETSAENLRRAVTRPSKGGAGVIVKMASLGRTDPSGTFVEDGVEPW